jgi:hypothetical protein
MPWSFLLRKVGVLDAAAIPPKTPMLVKTSSPRGRPTGPGAIHRDSPCTFNKLMPYSVVLCVLIRILNCFTAIEAAQANQA